jgi:hypothetical protein
MTTAVLETPHQAATPLGDGRIFEPGKFELAAYLVGFQGVLLIVTTAEAGVIALSGQAAGVIPVITTLLLAVFCFIARARLRKGKARRVVRFFQWSLLVWAGFDLALSLWLSSAALPLTGMVTRIALPVSVLVLTRKSK